MFRAGQKVECIDASPDRMGRPIVVELAGIYTISACAETWEGWGVTLVEVSPGTAKGWRAERFRAVVERKTDISIFTALLQDAKAPALA